MICQLLDRIIFLPMGWTTRSFSTVVKLLFLPNRLDRFSGNVTPTGVLLRKLATYFFLHNWDALNPNIDVAKLAILTEWVKIRN